MSDLYPKKKGRYHISSVPRAPEFKNGKRVFRGHGYDTSESSDNILYMMHVPMERTVTFKAFVDSFKVNLSKELEKKEENDKTVSLISQHAGEIKYDVTLNIPAHSVNEAANNVAKIEELQKLIHPVNKTYSAGRYTYLVPNAKTYLPIFKVFLKNLISNGENIKHKIDSRNASIEDLHNIGLPCFLESVKYEPDQEAGYFEEDGYLFPKNLKLTLALHLDQTTIAFSQIENFGASSVIFPFKEWGAYDSDDIGGFPFGVKVVEDACFADKINKPETNGAQYHALFSNKTLNQLEYGVKTTSSKIIEREDTYIYLSNGPANGEGRGKRWVLFKPFIESFSRDVSVNLRKNPSKHLNVRGGLVPGSEHTPKELKYDLKITLPAANVLEAKKNCGKLSYLTRMFFKEVNDAEIVKKAKKPQRKVYVYIPSMIESATAPYTKPGNTSHKLMQKYSLDLYFESLSFDINLDMGFFEEGKMLYPKEISITMGLFSENPGELFTNYTYDLLQDKYKHISSDVYTGKEAFFPFNRKTIILGD